MTVRLEYLWQFNILVKIQELKRKRDHVETKENYSWRSEECLAEVNGYDSDQIIIYSKLA